MEENNIMNNEEIMETTTEEIVEAASKGGFKKVATFGLGMIAGAVAYKYVLKPIGAKIKTWNEERIAKKHVVADATFDEVDETEENFDEE